MDYQQSIEFLKERTKFGVNLGLQRIQELLRRLGNPHKKLRFIHVTGTNGKGSVCSMISAICHEAGYKTGFFSSPHLHCYEERFRIDGEMIPRERLAALLTKIEPHLIVMHNEGWEAPTEFEVSTALALIYFFEEGVDIAVMEVGMGGSIDSTNIIDAETVVITTVAIDHTEYLGATIPDIALVKAGIIKDGSMVFTACDEPALSVISDVANRKRAVIKTVPGDISFQWQTSSLEGQQFIYRGMGVVIKDIKLPLLGSHQLSNAALAISAAISLNIDELTIKRGIAKTIWPARFELFSLQPKIILDGAHNKAAFKVLANTVKEVFPYMKIIAVVGMLADKDRYGALEQLLPMLAKAIITKPLSDRAGDWQYLISICNDFGVPALSIESIDKAVDCAIKELDDNCVLLICGSFYIVAAAREHLMSMFQDCGFVANLGVGQ